VGCYGGNDRSHQLGEPIHLSSLLPGQ